MPFSLLLQQQQTGQLCRGPQDVGELPRMLAWYRSWALSVLKGCAELSLAASWSTILCGVVQSLT